MPNVVGTTFESLWSLKTNQNRSFGNLDVYFSWLAWLQIFEHFAIQLLAGAWGFVSFDQFIVDILPSHSLAGACGLVISIYTAAIPCLRGWAGWCQSIALFLSAAHFTFAIANNEIYFSGLASFVLLQTCFSR